MTRKTLRIPLIALLFATSAAYAVTVNLTDSNGNTISCTLDQLDFQSDTVDINMSDACIQTADPNSAPVANNQSIAVVEGNSYSGTLSASDADGDALTFRIISAASNGTATITNSSTGAFTYTPSAGASSDSFSFRANDGIDDSNTAAVSVTVSAPGADPGMGTGTWLPNGNQTLVVVDNANGNTFLPNCVNGADWQSSSCETTGSMNDGQVYAIRMEYTGTPTLIDPIYAELGGSETSEWVIPYDMAVSDTPGDFNYQTGCAKPPNTWMRVWVADGPTLAQTDQSTQDEICGLDPGKLYYLNIRPNASNSGCGTDVDHICRPKVTTPEGLAHY